MTEQTDIKACPSCGMDMDGSGYELCDGVVCENCVDFLRFTIPITYIPNPHPCEERRPDLKEIFEDEDLTSRQKANMIEELRKLPLNRADPNPKSYYTVDRMHALTVREFQDKSAHAQAFRSQLLRRYNDYDTVCTVVTAEPMRRLRATDGIMKMKYYQGTLIVNGMLRLGKLRAGDTVTILRGGEEIKEAEIMEAAYVAGCLSGSSRGLTYSPRLSKVVEGHQVSLLLSPQAQGIAPGDLIVMDD